MTSRDRICITVHVAYVTSSRHHFVMDKRIFYMQRKKRVQTLLVIYPPQLYVCGLKIKVHLQGTCTL